MSHRGADVKRAVALVAALLLGACSTTSSPPTVGADAQSGGQSMDCSQTADARFPDVVDVDLELTPDGTVTVAATLCSAYDTPERYADAWRVLTPDGEELAVRELAHDHAAEQPFTRSLPAPIAVPGGVTSVVIEGRDLANGWGGATLEVPLPDA